VKKDVQLLLDEYEYELEKEELDLSSLMKEDIELNDE
jgi:hypothetical protein